VDSIFEWIFERIRDGLQSYGYPVLFLVVILENAGIPVPGETTVLLAGFFCSPAGGEKFHLEWVILITVVAAVMGDNIGFWLGYRFARARLQAGKRFLLLTPKTLQLAEGYFERYGLWTIFFARFITGIRVIGALSAGTAGMKWPRFLAANASGAVAWAVTMALLGYFFGHAWDLLHEWMRDGSYVVLGIVVIAAGALYLRYKLRKRATARLDAKVDEKPQPAPGTPECAADASADGGKTHT
jgi:membrane-associated protein